MHTKSDLEEDIDIDLEAKFSSSLVETNRMRKEDRNKNKQLHKYERKDHDLDEIEKAIVILNTKLQKAERIEEVVRSQLKEKEEICEKLEFEVVSLREELEKSNAQLHKSLNTTKTLNKILNCQTSPLIKTCLGYNGN